MYRDSSNGLYCDGMSPTSASTCSSFYSSASTGWGLFIDAIAAETGLISNDKAKENALLTLQTINDKWPRDSRGWFSHWTSPGSPDYIRQNDWEYSTIDSSIMIAGAVFAGNYFGGELSTLADSIKNTPDWNGSVDSGAFSICNIWIILATLNSPWPRSRLYPYSTLSRSSLKFHPNFDRIIWART